MKGRRKVLFRHAYSSATCRALPRGRSGEPPASARYLATHVPTYLITGTMGKPLMPSLCTYRTYTNLTSSTKSTCGRVCNGCFLALAADSRPRGLPGFAEMTRMHLDTTDFVLMDNLAPLTPGTVAYPRPLRVDCVLLEGAFGREPSVAFEPRDGGYRAC